MTESQPPAAASSSSKMLSVPGKIFILGEYAVLGGFPAWVAAIEPRFQFRISNADGSTNVNAKEDRPFHPESPAGQFATNLQGEFMDPWEGQGGFGGSTAEFAFAAYTLGIRDPMEAHAAYQKLFLAGEAPGNSLPSGADLLAQWTGGVIEWNPARGTLRDLSEEISKLPLLIFSASHLPGRKTKTHEHLKKMSLEPETFTFLQPILELATSALASGDLRLLGQAFTGFAEALGEKGWESEAANGDRMAISEMPGVIGVKGCGAMQSDAMIVLMESFSAGEDADAVEAVITFAEERGLRLLSRGVPRVPGIQMSGIQVAEAGSG